MYIASRREKAGSPFVLVYFRTAIPPRDALAILPLPHSRAACSWKSRNLLGWKLAHGRNGARCATPRRRVNDA